MYPKDRRYSTQHEWVCLKGEVARIGITDYAQQELGDIVFVELPEPGREVSSGETLGTIESVKAVSEIYAPIGGTVESVNEALTDGPEVVNSDPHDKGWYCTLRVADAAELDGLMEAEAYAEFVGQPK
jgi:glycine cleavage system H protein